MMGQPFVCNVCGADGVFEPQGDWREAPSCKACGSSVRVRQIVHCLTQGLFGASQALPTVDAKGWKGVGLSDPDLLADRLAPRFDYQNTFYHQAPRLDICAPSDDWAGRADFLISSDVFEHVGMPVQRAFDGAAKVLKDGGLLVLTVPFDDRPQTVEHFPSLHTYRLAEVNGGWILVNCTREGEIEIRRDLIFHGGPGSTLEMRFFGRQDVVRHLKAAGFEDIAFHDETVPEWGIFPPHAQGLPITARKAQTIRPVRKRGLIARLRALRAPVAVTV